MRFTIGQEIVVMREILDQPGAGFYRPYIVGVNEFKSFVLYACRYPTSQGDGWFFG